MITDLFFQTPDDIIHGLPGINFIQCSEKKRTLFLGDLGQQYSDLWEAKECCIERKMSCIKQRNTLLTLERVQDEKCNSEWLHMDRDTVLKHNLAKDENYLHF